MKIRNGFVSNSSSSSFIFQFNNKNKLYDNEIFFSQFANCVDIKIFSNFDKLYENCLFGVDDDMECVFTKIDPKEKFKRKFIDDEDSFFIACKVPYNDLKVAISSLECFDLLASYNFY